MQFSSYSALAARRHYILVCQLGTTTWWSFTKVSEFTIIDTDQKGTPMAAKRPPLQLHLLFHPKSAHARAFAEKLMDRFVEAPISGGLRIPVRFTPDRDDGSPPTLGGEERLDLDAAQDTIVVFLADQTLVQAARPSDRGRQWQLFHDQLKQLERQPRETAAETTRLHVFVVSLDDFGFQLSPDRHAVSGKLQSEPVADDGSLTPEERARRADEHRQAELRRLNEISLQIAIRAIQLLKHGSVPDQQPDKVEIPVCLFLSHAKNDLDRDRLQKKLVPDDPVRYVMARLQGLPLQQWFDSEQIKPGSDFAAAINAGLQDSTTIVAFLTDCYASRPWCRREILEAKQLGRPLLVVDALMHGEPRNFPYLGNLPTIRWSGPFPACRGGQIRAATPEEKNEEQEAAAIAAMQIIDRAVRESLKFLHNRRLAEQVATSGDVVLGAAPEALTLANHGAQAGAASAGDAGKKVFLYPDPPLAREELELLSTLRPDAEFVTPFIKRTRQRQPGEHRIIGVSISKSATDELARYGLSERHQQTLSDEVDLYLLLAGFQIGYGGLLSGDFSKESNFTVRLFELARSYARLAKESGLAKARPILNFAPWPYRLDYGAREFALFQLDGIAPDDQYAQYEEGPAVPTPRPIDAVFPPLSSTDREAGKIRFKINTAEQRSVLARGLTAMREQMTRDVHARLVIGGKLDDFAGYHPGIFEEAWLSLTKNMTGEPGKKTGPPGQALFLVGAFGGAARAVIDVLEGRDRAEFTETHARSSVPHYDDGPQFYAAHGETFVTRDALRCDLRTATQSGLSTALNNGLNDAQNRELFRATDPARIAELVLTGLTTPKAPG
jgi:SLOG-like protein/TIR domain-containing protein